MKMQPFRKFPTTTSSLYISAHPQPYVPPSQHSSVVISYPCREFRQTVIVNIYCTSKAKSHCFLVPLTSSYTHYSWPLYTVVRNTNNISMFGFSEPKKRFGYNDFDIICVKNRPPLRNRNPLRLGRQPIPQECVLHIFLCKIRKKYSFLESKPLFRQHVLLASTTLNVQELVLENFDVAEKSVFNYYK